MLRMLFGRKKDSVRRERYKGFQAQTTFDCRGNLKTVYFDLSLPLDERFIEYLKPFGYPMSMGGGMVEIQREGYFRLLMVPGRTSFIARFVKNCAPHARIRLITQVQRAVNFSLMGESSSRCPEGALSVENGSLSIDLTKCTYCLDCI